MSPNQVDAYRDFLAAEAYRTFALKRRESKNITATLKEAHPILEIEPSVLDKDWYLLRTPGGTFDLRKGLEGLRKHSPDDFITKMTAYAPSDKGAEIWQDALNTFFCSDPQLIEYVQRVAGVVCVGQVFLEAMVTILAAQTQLLTKLFKRSETDEAPDAIRFDAFEQLQGLRELWAKPFEARYSALDGEVVVQLKRQDECILIAADIVARK